MNTSNTLKPLVRPLDVKREPLDRIEVLKQLGSNSRLISQPQLDQFITVYNYHPYLPKEDLVAFKYLKELHNIMGQSIIQDMLPSAEKYKLLIVEYNQTIAKLQELNNTAYEYSNPNLLGYLSCKLPVQQEKGEKPYEPHIF